MRKSIRKNITHSSPEKVAKSLHFVRGEHNINHSHTPISADELERLVAINPEYVQRLFSIIEQSVTLEGREIELYFDAVKNEQEKDKEFSRLQEKIASKSLYVSSAVIVFLIGSAVLFVWLKQPLIAGAVVSTVIGVVVKAIMGKSSENEKA